MTKVISPELAAYAAELMKTGMSVEKIRSLLKASKSGDEYRRTRHAGVRLIAKMSINGTMTATDIEEIKKTSIVAWMRRHHTA